MAFTTQRGRPRKPVLHTDLGTPELRLKHALRLTAEPIDLCLEKRLITEDQHWSGLHLRWLYTLRYGAPNLSTYYGDRDTPARGDTEDDPAWRTMREREYHEATTHLKRYRRYECVMRLAIHNERPAFLDAHLMAKARAHHALAQQMSRVHAELSEGLDILATLWRRPHIN